MDEEKLEMNDIHNVVETAEDSDEDSRINTYGPTFEKEGVGPFEKISSVHNNFANEYFAKKNYAEALDEYSMAIKYGSNISKYYSNRALCCIMMKKWNEALEDCRKALDLDAQNMKALVTLATCLVEMEKIENRSHQNYFIAIKALEDAMKTAEKDPIGNRMIILEIETKLHRARKLYHLCVTQQEGGKHQRTRSFVEEMIEKQENDVNVKTTMQNMFNEVLTQNENEKPSKDIPDHLACKVSYDIMRNPVISPSGISYEKNIIKEHIERVGYFDPVTRKPIDHTMLAPNNNLRQAINYFYDRNPENFEPEKKKIQDIVL